MIFDIDSPEVVLAAALLRESRAYALHKMNFDSDFRMSWSRVGDVARRLAAEGRLNPTPEPAPRCEPPDEWTAYPKHVVERCARFIVIQWLPADREWLDLGDVRRTPEEVFESGWRYLGPVLTAETMAALRAERRL